MTKIRAIILAAATGGAAILVAGQGNAHATQPEVPITYDIGHVDMRLNEPGQQVMHFWVGGRECVALGEGGGDETHYVLSVSCNWSPK